MDSWIEKDLKYSWHPYTQMKDYQSFGPMLIERAEGIKLYDSDGKFYYDTISSWWCNVHGHSHPKIKTAIKKQLDTLDHVLFAGITHKPAIELSEKLIAISPESLTRIFFTDNGSTAVETALKMSFQYWYNLDKKNKTKFVSLDMSYHGDTVGAMSVGGASVFNEVFEKLLFDSFKVPSPYCYRCPVGKCKDTCDIECIKPLEECFKQHHNKIAGMIFEPLLMAAAGMVIYPVRYLEKAAQLAKKYDIHLIADEVATGFGRTGKMFAIEHANLQPDFMCVSKGLTSGTLPLAATLTTDKVYDAFYDDFDKHKTFYHGHTFTANPIGCATALATLDIFEQEQTLKKAQDLITILHDGMEKFRALDFVGDVRCLGMVGAIELVQNKETKEPFDAKDRVGLNVYKEGLKENLLLRPLGNVIYLCPPLCTTKAQLKDILTRMYTAVTKAMS